MYFSVSKNPEQNSESKTDFNEMRKMIRIEPIWKNLPEEILQHIFTFLMSNQCDLRERIKYLSLNSALRPLFHRVDNIGVIAQALLGKKKSSIQLGVFEQLPNKVIKVLDAFVSPKGARLVHFLSCCTHNFQKQTTELTLQLSQQLDLNLDKESCEKIGFTELRELAGAKDELIYHAWILFGRTTPPSKEEILPLCRFINRLFELCPRAAENLIRIRAALFQQLLNMLESSFSSEYKCVISSLQQPTAETFFITFNRLLKVQKIRYDTEDGILPKKYLPLFAETAARWAEETEKKKSDELQRFALIFNECEEALIAYLALKHSRKRRPGALDLLSERLQKSRHFVMRCLPYISLWEEKNLKIVAPFLQERSFVVQALGLGIPIDLRHLPQQWCEDREIMRALLANNSHNLAWLPKQYHGDKELILSALKSRDEMNQIPDFITADRELFLVALKSYFHDEINPLDDFSRELLKDEAFLEQLFIQNSMALEWIIEKRKEPFIPTEEVLLKAIAVQGVCVLKDFKEFITKEDPQAFDPYADNEAIIAAAIEHSSLALSFASPALKNSKALVLRAVKKNGNALQFASQELQNDEEVLLAALQTNPEACIAIPPKRHSMKMETIIYRSDNLYTQFLLSNNVAVFFPKGSEKLRDDKEVALQVVQQKGNYLLYVSSRLKGDRELVLLAVKNTGAALAYASDELKNDIEIVKEAVKRDRSAFWFASDSLKNNAEILELL